ncbi:MAG: CMGC/MAPK protein kinase [Sylvanvirus sp.]|uniref:CMGC/MAPK protein kinase n=1 Tax=Sylvanvirus sp. TaxID=2487774 RepID=A0A3G5AHZ1_9VIRU|nr:MAG: CMGC/MAPK protein kinase [Sylvanvirus sp.]
MPRFREDRYKFFYHTRLPMTVIATMSIPTYVSKHHKVESQSNKLTASELPPEYTSMKLKGHGSYGLVYEAFNTNTNEKVVIKKVTGVFDNYSNSKRMLREIKILRAVHNHPNIVSLQRVVLPPTSTNDVNMVMECVDTDLHQLFRSNQYFTNIHIKYFLYQILCAIHFLHSASIIHRDLKPSNILVYENCQIRLGDFGLSRCLQVMDNITPHFHPLYPITPPPSNNSQPKQIDQSDESNQSNQSNQSSSTIESISNTIDTEESPNIFQVDDITITFHKDQVPNRNESATKINEEISQCPIDRPMDSPADPSVPPPLLRTLTGHVVTRWYRSPEIALLSEQYGTAIDMWSIGCIFSELLMMQKESGYTPSTRSPLFPGRTCFPLTRNTELDYLSPRDQLNLIFNIIGTPALEDLDCIDNLIGRQYVANLTSIPPQDLQKRFVGADPLAIDLLKKLLHFNPSKRISAWDALNHPYLISVVDSNKELTFPLWDTWSPQDEFSLLEYYKFEQQLEAQQYVSPLQSHDVKDICSSNGSNDSNDSKRSILTARSLLETQDNERHRVNKERAKLRDKYKPVSDILVRKLLQEEAERR